MRRKETCHGNDGANAGATRHAFGSRVFALSLFLRTGLRTHEEKGPLGSLGYDQFGIPNGLRSCLWWFERDEIDGSHKLPSRLDCDSHCPSPHCRGDSYTYNPFDHCFDRKGKDPIFRFHGLLFNITDIGGQLRALLGTTLLCLHTRFLKNLDQTPTGWLDRRSAFWAPFGVWWISTGGILEGRRWRPSLLEATRPSQGSDLALVTS